MVEAKCTQTRYFVISMYYMHFQMAHFFHMACKWHAIFALWHANGNFLHGTLLYCIDPPI